MGTKRLQCLSFVCRCVFVCVCLCLCVCMHADPLGQTSMLVCTPVCAFGPPLVNGPKYHTVVCITASEPVGVFMLHLLLCGGSD